ncbi:TRAPP trafficking subunit Trs65-domain-containing protein, partial [Plectosphaerella plurivora]
MAVDEYLDMDPIDGAYSFIENSYLSYIIPRATDLDLEKASQDLEDTGALFETIEKRQSLYFDETIHVHLILRTPLVDEAVLRSCLARLHISLEAHIVSSINTERDNSPQPDIIFQGVVDETDDPFIVVDASEDSDEDDEESQPHIYAVWKLPVFLARPRARTQNPLVSFKATASLKPIDAATAMGEQPGYMRSGMPAGFNILESFNSDPALGGIVPRLSALRVSRVAPITQSKHSMRPIRSQPGLELRIYPAIHTRMRFSRPNSAPVSAAVIALLEVDFTSHFACKTTVDSIQLSVPDTIVDNLNTHAGLALPLACVAYDHVTFMYRLAPQEAELVSKSPTRDLHITIQATIHDTAGLCTPKLTLDWTTTVDFTVPVNPGYGSASQPIQRSHRPSQLSIGGSDASQSLTAPSVSRPDALPVLEAATQRSTETSIPDLGLTMTFCAPKTPVYPGDTFVWTVYVVNRTSEKPGVNSGPSHRKLALLAIPKRRRNDVRVIRPPSTAGKGKTVTDGRQMADAVLDENVVHAMQRSSFIDSTDIVCLSADTRVGPLAPGACHVTEMKFVALKAGLVSMDAIRVIDLGTQEHVDIRDLPVMIISEREDQE